MGPLIIGTAGHIDHGKSALVRALTGEDPDRLEEEKRRGITIELGFAQLTLPSGRLAGMVDVPGHERFIRMMIAGATGVDLVLLVIAADEGVMPQTREHVDILSLLGVKGGLIVLSKVDLVDEELRSLAEMDVEEFMEGTFLEGAPIIPVSSLSGEGIPELLQAIDEAAESLSGGPGRGGPEAPPRLAVDRVFSQRGFGTVVTGTLSQGQVSTGDSLLLLPQGQPLKVRGVQVHGQDVDAARPGNRAAINLQGVERESINRGDVLTVADGPFVTSMIDATVRALGDLEVPLGGRWDPQTQEAAPGAEAQRVRFLTGTLEVLGRLMPLDPGMIPGGEEGLCQIRLERPIPIAPGDAFILRRESPMETIGGGRVINPLPKRHRRRDRLPAANSLRRLMDPETALHEWLDLGGVDGIELGRLSRLSGREVSELEAQLKEGARAGWALALGERGYVSKAILEDVQSRVVARLETYHQEKPLTPGVSQGALSPGPWIPEGTLNLAIETLLHRGEIQAKGAIFCRRGFSIHLTPQEQGVADSLLRALREGGLTPPSLKEPIEAARGAEGIRDIDALLTYLIHRGDVLRVKASLFFDAKAVEGMVNAVKVHLETHGEMSPKDFKALTGLSRKYAIPLLEHIDRIQLTLRVGDIRRLRR